MMRAALLLSCLGGCGGSRIGSPPPGQLQAKEDPVVTATSDAGLEAASTDDYDMMMMQMHSVHATNSSSDQCPGMTTYVVPWTTTVNGAAGDHAGSITYTAPTFGLSFDGFATCVDADEAACTIAEVGARLCTDNHNVPDGVRVLRRTDTNVIVGASVCCNVVQAHAQTPTSQCTDATPTQTDTCTASAKGDPHLQNIHGERFDVMRPGKFVLIHIPRGAPVEDALLVAEADARRLGGQCADMYFQQVNITGAWADKAQTGGLYFDAHGARDEKPKWAKLGPVEVKVAHGRTAKGHQYLNIYVKHLGRAGFAVGGLLGEDDHTEAAAPEEGCQKSLFLKKGP